MCAVRGSRGAPDRAPATTARRAGAAVIAAVAACAIAPQAHADRIAERRAEADQVLLQIREANARLEKTVQAYDAASLRLHQTQSRIRVNTERLHVARSNLRAARQDLKQSLVTAYKSGQPDMLEAVLSSGSFTTMLDQVELIRRANNYNADIVVRVRGYKAEVVTRQHQLAHEKKQRAAAVHEQARKKAAIQAGIAEQKRRWDAIQEDIRRLIREKIAAERRAAAERERLARAALLAAQARQQQAVSTGVGGVVSVQSTDAAPAASTAAPAVPDPSTDAPAPDPTTSEPAATTYTPPPASGTGAQAAQIALGEQGVPYVWGGASPSGFDCSGLVMWAYAQVGISLPHSSYALYNVGTHVSQSELAPGDLVFFDGLGHVGIYIGNGAFVHAPHTGDVVKVSSLGEGWYASSYVGAVRVTG